MRGALHPMHSSWRRRKAVELGRPLRAPVPAAVVAISKAAARAVVESAAKELLGRSRAAAIAAAQQSQRIPAGPLLQRPVLPVPVLPGLLLWLPLLLLLPRRPWLR